MLESDGGSHFWQSLVNVNDIFQGIAKRVVGDGAKTLVSGDKWMGDMSLAESFPRLYGLAFNKNATVKQILDDGLDEIEFIRTLHGETVDQWEEVRHKVSTFEYRETQERVEWPLNSKKIKFLGQGSLPLA